MRNEKMKIKNILFGLSAAVAITFTLAGCGNGQNNGNNSAALSSSCVPMTSAVNVPFGQVNPCQAGYVPSSWLSGTNPGGTLPPGGLPPGAQPIYQNGNMFGAIIGYKILSPRSVTSPAVFPGGGNTQLQFNLGQVQSGDRIVSSILNQLYGGIPLQKVCPNGISFDFGQPYAMNPNFSVGGQAVNLYYTPASIPSAGELVLTATAVNLDRSCFGASYAQVYLGVGNQPVVMIESCRTTAGAPMACPY